MKTVKISTVDSIYASVLESNPPSLLINANGHTNTGGYTNIRLEPFIYKKIPTDGIWEFDMVADAPTGIINQMVTPVATQYHWKEYSPAVKGIKVYSAGNSKVTMLNEATPRAATVQTGIQIIKATAQADGKPTPLAPGGTLTVNIDYNSNQHGFHGLSPVVPQGINPRILLLEITDFPEMIYIFNPRHNSYSTGLQSATQYSVVQLMYQGNKVKAIDVTAAPPAKKPKVEPEDENVPFPLNEAGERVPFPFIAEDDKVPFPKK